jgi:microsomal dipeptidase-like Zn-dependent dipeptidase
MPKDCTPPITRREFLAATAACAIVGSASADAEPKSGPYVDGMSFLPERPAQIRESQLDAFLCDVSSGKMDTDAAGRPFYHRTFELCDQSIDAAGKYIQQHHSAVRLALTGADLAKPGPPAAIFQFQGCEPLGRELARIEHFRNKSLRVLQLTHNESNAFATAYTDERSGAGLSALGRDGLAEMNRLSVIPDVSHASEATALEVVSASNSPVILSHGACRSLLQHPRCATDAMLRAVADCGGVFGVFMMSFWLTDASVPTAEHFVAHVRHAVKTAGIDAVGIANDNPMAGLMTSDRGFDNRTDMESYAPWWEASRERGIPGFGPLPGHAVIPELNNIDRMPLIHRALLSSGFSAIEADKVMGGNWARFFKDNLR